VTKRPCLKSTSAARDIEPVAKQGNSPMSRAMRVFLVEDLPAVRTLVIENLQEIEGVRLAGFAETEDGALAWLGSHDCEVLILDLELKQGNGMGVLKHLASAEPRPGLTKIIYSNHVGPNIRRLAAKLGAAYFFDKSLDTPQLRVLLEHLSAKAQDAGMGSQAA
jgi:DNA-binding NarL/FixJ family response regulator